VTDVSTHSPPPVRRQDLLTARPQWSSFFVMSSVNAAVVRRSQQLHRSGGAGDEAAAPPYAYDEAMGTGRGCAGLTIALVLSLVPIIGGVLLMLPPTRWLLQRLAPRACMS
jgi:hypothetical protein